LQSAANEIAVVVVVLFRSKDEVPGFQIVT
jgi:hypothetical protein